MKSRQLARLDWLVAFILERAMANCGRKVACAPNGYNLGHYFPKKDESYGRIAYAALRQKYGFACILLRDVAN